jgi:arylsulfatase A-like enzyme
MSPARALLVLFALLLAGPGCRSKPLDVRCDLAAHAHSAERVLPDGTRVVVSPPAEIHPEGGGQPRRRFEQRLFVHWGASPPSRVLLDVDVARDRPSLTIAAQFGRQPAVSLAAQGGRRAYALAPRRGTPSRRWTTLLLAAELEGWTESYSPFVARDVAVRGEPGPLPTEEDEGTIVQCHPGALRFALRRPEGAQLRFTPSLTRSSTARARLAVSVQVPGAAERELWAADVTPGRVLPEVAVSTGGRTGDPILVSFHHGGGPESCASWTAPRLLGRGPGPDARPSAGPSEDPRVVRLRRSLARASVLVVVLDAGSALHLHSYGYARETTPEIDRLAGEGVLFERAYTPVPFTVSAISSLWTSELPDQHHFGVRHNAPLPAGRLTLAEVLSGHGIATCGFVANIAAGHTFGLDRGFTEFHQLYEGPDGFRLPRARAFREVVRPWLERTSSGSRFFAYLHFLEPHFPYDPPPPFDTRFGPDGPLPHAVRRDPRWYDAVGTRRLPLSPSERDHLVRLYDGNLAYVDGEVGWLREQLEREGRLESTVLIVTADHGEALLQRGYLGHGGDLHEESVRVPLIVRFPRGLIPGGLRRHGLVDLTDVAPTIADIFGLLGQDGTDRAFEGRSLLPMLFGASGKNVVISRTRGEHPSYALVRERYKLIYNTKNGRAVLYDLEHDPGEGRDISDAEPLWTEFQRQDLYRRLHDLRRPRAGVEEGNLTPAEIQLLRALGYVQ